MIQKTLYKLAPRRLKDSIKVLLGRATVADPTSAPRGRAARLFDCPVCGSRAVRFLPLDSYAFNRLNQHQHIYSYFQYETGNAEHYTCSVCGASDRDRLFALYAGRVLARTQTPQIILEIAPDRPFTEFLRSFPGVRVRTADLYQPNVDDKVDLTDMAIYSNEQFDAFVCSHVLEHITDDRVAMKELYRVLKPGGWGIAMVPIHLGLSEIVEDPTITDEPGRWKHFGQGDHVRIYTKGGFVERLRSVGFEVLQLDRSFFGSDVYSKSGICPRSVLYVVKK